MKKEGEMKVMNEENILTKVIDNEECRDLLLALLHNIALIDNEKNNKWDTITIKIISSKVDDERINAECNYNKLFASANISLDKESSIPLCKLKIDCLEEDEKIIKAKVEMIDEEDDAMDTIIDDEFLDNCTFIYDEEDKIKKVPLSDEMKDYIKKKLKDLE